MFPEFVAVPDEVALILNDAMLVFEASGELPSLDSQVFDKIKKLDEYFNTLDKSEFTTEALCNSPRWAVSRKLAGEIMGMLGISAKRLDLDWIIFIKGGS
ncbi:MAG TPA: hypothetical protein VIV15_04235 [Anaerolineales bacterium]